MFRVFISYSHDSDEHRNRVQALAEQLRSNDVAVVIDRDTGPGGPPQGWPAWSQAQVEDADRVLVACTETYSRRYDVDEVPGKGLGAVSEARVIRQLLYKTGGFNEKFRVILFDEGDNDHIPTDLEGYHRFLLYQNAAYDELLAWLAGSSLVGPYPTAEPPVIRWPAADADYVWQLADRKGEFAFFQRMVTGGSSQRIFLLRGVSNTGKTVLRAELVSYARRLKLPTASLDFKGCPSLEDLFEQLRLDLGQQVLRGAYTETGTARFYQLISDLRELKEPVLLVFDTYEQASVDSQRWLESQLLPRLDRAPAVVVMIGGQKTPEHEKQSWRALTEARDLQPISKVEDWLEYSQRKWDSPRVNADHVKALTLATGGNPGQLSALLETMVRGLQGEPHD